MYALLGAWDTLRSTWAYALYQGVYAFDSISNQWNLVKLLDEFTVGREDLNLNTLNISNTLTKVILSDLAPNYDLLIEDDESQPIVDGKYLGVYHNDETDSLIDEDGDADDSIIPHKLTTERPIRNILTGTVETGLTASSAENWHYEDQYIWNNTTDSRIWINDRDYITIIHPEATFETRLTNTTEIFDPENGALIFNADKFTISDFIGYTEGAVIYDEITEKLVCYNKLPSVTRLEASFDWYHTNADSGNGIVAEAILNYTKPVVDQVIPEECTTPRDCIPTLEPFAERFLPSHYVFEEPKFIEFIKVYLKYLSDNSYSNYGELHNLIRNHDINESVYTDFTTIFETDLMKRNIIVTPDKRKQLNQFLHNTAVDFYSIKGTEDSYKFLFQLLYNVDVEVKVENDYLFNFLVDVEIVNVYDKITNNIITDKTIVFNEDFNSLVSSTRGFSTNQSNAAGSTEATPSERFYGHIVLATPIDFSTRRFTLSLVDQYGVPEVNKEYIINLSNEYVVCKLVPRYTGNLIDLQYKSSTGETLTSADSGASNYIIRIKTSIPLSTYKDDIIRFVHPVGFDFIAAYLISSATVANIPSQHVETIVDFFESFKWDSGIPARYPTGKALFPIIIGDDYLGTPDPVLTGSTVLYNGKCYITNAEYVAADINNNTNVNILLNTFTLLNYHNLIDGNIEFYIQPEQYLYDEFNNLIFTENLYYPNEIYPADSTTEAVTWSYNSDPDRTIGGYGAMGQDYADFESSSTDTSLSILARRRNNSPLFDASWGRFYDRANINNPLYYTLFSGKSRLKDDPSNDNATQRKVE